MGNFITGMVGKLATSAVKPKEGRSPFTAKTVMLAGSLFIGSLYYWISGPDKAAAASWLQSAAPGTMALSGSYLGGFFIGWGARRALKVTSIIAAGAIALIALLVSWGMDGATAQSWVNSATAWIGGNIEGAQRYLVSLLPSATAAGAGGVLGFKRK